MAGREMSKNLPLAEKGCGGIEQARRRSRMGFSRPHSGYRKRRKIAPTTAVSQSEPWDLFASTAMGEPVVPREP
jgi:hypothetical protein